MRWSTAGAANPCIQPTAQALRYEVMRTAAADAQRRSTVGPERADGKGDV